MRFMPSQKKLIKQGIKYTDSLFDEIIRRLNQGVRASDTLESFLEATKEYTTQNPLVTSGYDQQMLSLILQETNNHKFSRPAQKELVRVIVEQKVGEKIVDVGEDIIGSVREVVKDGYNNNLSEQEIASNISKKVTTIKNKRARAIARTEVARTATVSDYIINKERGATHWYVECRNTACPKCKKAWHEGWTEENDSNFNPSDKSAGGKGWIGDKVYSINDTSSLPPIHPNCRCVVYFVYENEIPENGVIVETPVKQQTTTTETVEEHTTEDPRIKQLEDDIKFYEEAAEKWRKRGNASMAAIMEKSLKKAQSELEELKKKPKETNKPKPSVDDNVINNILADALKDVGLDDLAPEKKHISPDVVIEKNIQTTHKSNLWESLAEKHGFELVEASETRVTFYDNKHKTPIQFNIPKNKEWMDYTNHGRKQVNMEDVLTYYNSASTIQKKATPIMIIQGHSLDHGAVSISRNEFKLELFHGAFIKEKGSINGGNPKGAMHHEMWHCVDIRLSPEERVRNNPEALESNMKGSAYKKDVTADRRSKKKTGGSNFVSAYARQSGSGNKVYEDFAEAGSVMSSDTYLVQDAIGGYVNISKEEFKQQYPNRARHFEDLMENGELLW